MNEVTATFRNGETVTRRTEATYTHASRTSPTAKVRFHTHAVAARRAAGEHGEVVETVGCRETVVVEAAEVERCSVCGEAAGVGRDAVHAIADRPEIGRVHGRCVGRAMGR